MCESIPATSILPRTNPGHLLHESRRPGIWKLIMFRPPGHLQTTKKLACNILSLFPTGLRVKGFRHRRFEMRRSFIDHKRRVSVKPGTPQNPRNPPESPWNPSELPRIPGTSPEPPWNSSKPPGTFRYTCNQVEIISTSLF